MALPVIDVAVAAVFRPDGRVLLAQRTARQLAAGFWEMPGGKIEPGETAMQAAARELFEETGIQPAALTPWLRYEHAFATKRVRLQFFKVEGWSGTPQGREGQRIAWADPADPDIGPILQSNTRALTALGLPAEYAVIDGAPAGGAPHPVAQLQTALCNGARLIRVRRLHAAPGQAAALLARMAAIARPFAGVSLLAGNVADASRAGLAGVHSCARELRRLDARPPVRVWGATCHSPEDVETARRLGADFIVAGPVLPDPQIPHQAPLGWEGLRHLAATCPLAIYAQGGVDASHARHARNAGATGVVVNCADMPADGPARQAPGHARPLQAAF